MLDDLTYGKSDGQWTPVHPLSIHEYTDIAPGGRLSFSRNDPGFVQSEVITSIYYVPYLTPVVPIWDGLSWDRRLLTRPLLNSYADGTENPGPVTPSTCADLFVWSDRGTLKLCRGPGWTPGYAAPGAGPSTGLTRPPLIREANYTLNGYNISNGPDLGRGTWVGTVSIWTQGASYLRYTWSTSGDVLCLYWNTYNRLPIALRVMGYQPPDAASGWVASNCVAWIVAGDLVPVQLCASQATNAISDFHMCIGAQNFNLGGDTILTYRGVSRIRAVTSDPHACLSCSCNFGPGLGDFRLLTYGSPRSFRNYLSPISALYDA